MLNLGSLHESRSYDHWTSQSQCRVDRRSNKRLRRTHQLEDTGACPSKSNISSSSSWPIHLPLSLTLPFTSHSRYSHWLPSASSLSSSTPYSRSIGQSINPTPHQPRTSLRHSPFFPQRPSRHTITICPLHRIGYGIDMGVGKMKTWSRLRDGAG